MNSSGKRHLSIDIETYSSEDLPSVGVYKYAAAPDFKVLLFAYAWDDEDVQIVDLTREDLPGDVLSALTDEEITKHAFNATFERVCLSAFLGMPEGKYLHPSSWRCTMVQAAYWGASGSLKTVGGFLDVEMEKDAAGTRLINKFSKPQKKAPERAGADWERFKRYCIRDVECEREISCSLPGPIPQREQELYVLDQTINDYGVRIDTTLAHASCDMAENAARAAKERLSKITGLANPNSVAQLLPWLQSRGCYVESCGRDVLAKAAADPECDPLVKEAINIRLGAAKASVKKYIVARDAAGRDERLRGCFAFYGAATGRWAGRLMQLQNLPRGDLHGTDLEIARTYVRDGDTDAVRMLFGDVQDTLKSLVRTVLIPREGCRFAVADYSAIEARVLAWLASEKWALDVFKGDGKVYEATASRMFGIPIERVTKDLRARGKVATLALGYQGGPAALERMGALDMGIPREELPKLVRMWRNANKRIKASWAEAEEAVISALGGLGPQRICSGKVLVQRDRRLHGGLTIKLPSGRELCYRNARLRSTDNHIVYEVCSKGAKPLTIETYGGRIMENITQAVARDLLADALRRVSKHYRIVAHVHDEIIAEVPAESAKEDLARILDEMCAGDSWVDASLPLSADGYICDNYRKE